MKDIKNILNKMKFIPEELQDVVLENIKECIEKEIVKSYDPIKLLIEKLNKLNFGNDTEQDRKIIRIIIKCMPCDWFFMKPKYCEAVQKTKDYGDWTSKWYVNESFKKFIKNEIKDIEDENDAYYLIRQIAQEAKNKKIDVIDDSYWIHKDGANGEIWFHTTPQLAKEMIYWFEDCFSEDNEDDVETAYKILNELEKSFPQKD